MCNSSCSSTISALQALKLSHSPQWRQPSTLMMASSHVVVGTNVLVSSTKKWSLGLAPQIQRGFPVDTVHNTNWLTYLLNISVLLWHPCSHRLALSSMHCVLCVVSNYIFLFAHHAPRHQCNESSATGVFSSDPTEYGYQISCCVILCLQNAKIFTVRSHILQYSWLTQWQVDSVTDSDVLLEASV